MIKGLHGVHVSMSCSDVDILRVTTLLGRVYVLSIEIRPHIICYPNLFNKLDMNI